MLDESAHDGVGLTRLDRAWQWLVPPQRNRAVPWGALEILLVLAGFGLLLPLFLVVLYRRCYPLLRDSELVLDSIVTAELVTVLAVPWLLHRSSGTMLYQLGVHSDRLGRNALLGVGAWFVATPIVMIVLTAALFFCERTPHAVEQMIVHAPPADRIMHSALAAIAVVLIAPVQEELVFRGVLQPWLRRLIGPRPAIVGSSMIFAALHADAWPAPIPLFVLAIFLGYLANRTGSLVAPVLLHATFNGANMLMLSIAVGRGT